MPTKSITDKTESKRQRGSIPSAPFTNGQQAILQLLNRPLTSQQLHDIEELIQQYLAKQSDALAEQVWEQKNYTDADMDQLLTMHVRSPYQKG